jgi:hypothetical protein
MHLATSDSRVSGAIDFDGQVSPPFRGETSKPMMLAGRPGHSLQDATWNATWPYLVGPKAEVTLNETTHASFTDLPALVGLLGLPDNVRGQLGQVLGQIDPATLDQALTGLVSAFAEVAFVGAAKGLRDLQRQFSEIEVLRSGGLN